MDERTLEELREAAENGEPEAMYLLGMKYEKGDGVPEDWDTARAWFVKAIQKNHSKARSHLAYQLEMRDDVRIAKGNDWGWADMSETIRFRRGRN
ncbi:MAG: hypothetical protein MJZ68_09180 [archaeon]|nr:hypothetical protein [archaeon]